MTFAFATDERALHAFRDEAEATAYAEGIDVEDGVWLFFAQDGTPLEPVFTTANQRGWFTVRSGAYRLQKTNSQQVSGLLELLPQAAAVEGELTSVQSVRRFLANGSSQ